MQMGQPSRTALGAAALRAAHQVLDGAAIFTDPLALRVLGCDAEAMLHDASDVSRQRLRWFIANRPGLPRMPWRARCGTAFVSWWCWAPASTPMHYRTPPSDHLRIFEVDHPTTQAWKRTRLAGAAIALPPTLRFVPVDFERETLADGLSAAGFDPAQQTFFTWLGVVPYLTEQAVLATLGFIAGLPGGAHVVLDYVNPTASIVEEGRRAAHEALTAQVAALGETFQCHFDTEQLGARLAKLGFRDVEDLGPGQIAERFFPGRVTSSGGGAHVLRAASV